MDEALINRLLKVSDSEAQVLSKTYSLASDAEPAFAYMLLKRRDYIWNVIGSRQPIAVTSHTRFVDIPLHSHSYVEIMYVCEGSVKHFIEGEDLTLKKGSLLLMNRHIKHSITASGKNDIAVNFILSNDFLSANGGRLRSSSSLTDLAENNGSEIGRPRFLVFNVENIPYVENLIENLIRSYLFDKDVPHIILSETMSLILRYLSMYPETLADGFSSGEGEGSIKAAISDYIQTNYRSASLAELAEQLGLTLPYASKLIKQLYGASFRELVKEKRFSEAEQLLLSSNVSIQEISEAVGYENNSFFHKMFKEQYGMTPAKWKKTAAAVEKISEKR